MTSTFPVIGDTAELNGTIFPSHLGQSTAINLDKLILLRLRLL
jgi:hypothetical protein